MLCWTFDKKHKVEKLKLKLKKFKTQEFFCQNLKILSNLSEISWYNLGLKSGKIVQKLRNIPKTQGKFPKYLIFQANLLHTQTLHFPENCLKKPDVKWSEVDQNYVQYFHTMLAEKWAVLIFPHRIRICIRFYYL